MYEAIHEWTVLYGGPSILPIPADKWRYGYFSQLEIIFLEKIEKAQESRIKNPRIVLLQIPDQVLI